MILQIRTILILVLSFSKFSLFTQNKGDGLLNLLKGAGNKSGMFNLLSEAVLEDPPLELSYGYAQKNLIFSIHENNLQQHKLAYFNTGIVVSKSINYGSILNYAYNGIGLACNYVANGVKKQYSIEGISEKVGFKSKSTFNIAFNKMSGVTTFILHQILEKRKGRVL